MNENGGKPGKAGLARALMLVNIGRLLVAPALLAMTAACAIDQAVQQPALQRFVWYSYLNGEDLREACAEGSLPRYRFVYNGRYQEQLRRYEVLDDGGGGAYVIANAQGSGNLANVNLNDVLAPWRWHRSQVQISPQEFAQFKTALQTSGVFEPAPEGLHLPSAGFYWVAVACQGGQVQFNAWRYPSPRFDRLAFPAFLYARDLSEVPVNPPREIDAAELLFVRQPSRTSSTRYPVFSLRVGDNGLEGY